MHKPHISRRDFLRLGALSAAWAGLAACSLREPPETQLPSSTTKPPGTREPSFPTLEATPGLQTPDATPRAPLDEAGKVLHAVRRLSFGFTPDTLEKAKRLGLEDYLEEQLNPDTSTEDERIQLLREELDIYNKTPEELFEIEERGSIVGQFILSTLLQHTFSRWQVNEMMVDFWSNHFNIFLGDSFVYVLKIFDDQNVIRMHSLSSFRELLQASAHSPAMLVYLDQAGSTKRNPNENYARELLELHTVGVNGGYAHEDIDEVARVFTGWGVVARESFFRPGVNQGEFIFRPFAHDNGPKQVMGFDIPGRGEREGIALLDFLANHPSTARFIAYKLAVRFVADQPPASVVDKLEESFANSQGDIRSLIRTLAGCEEFYASAKRKFKRPLEFFVSSLIASQAELIPNSRGLRMLLEPLRTMGQIPYLWPAPDGYPDEMEWWTTSSGMLARWNFAIQLVNNEFPGVQVPLRRMTQDGESTEDIVDILSYQFLGEPLPAAARQVIVDYASGGDLGTKIADIAALILGGPYFQYR